VELLAQDAVLRFEVIDDRELPAIDRTCEQQEQEIRVDRPSWRAMVAPAGSRSCRRSYCKPLRSPPSRTIDLSPHDANGVATSCKIDRRTHYPDTTICRGRAALAGRRVSVFMSALAA
jgi:hypothetical protein